MSVHVSIWPSLGANSPIEVFFCQSVFFTWPKAITNHDSSLYLKGIAMVVVSNILWFLTLPREMIQFGFLAYFSPDRLKPPTRSSNPTNPGKDEQIWTVHPKKGGLLGAQSQAKLFFFCSFLQFAYQHPWEWYSYQQQDPIKNQPNVGKYTIYGWYGGGL